MVLTQPPSAPDDAKTGADEALFEAALHPTRNSKDLSDGEIKALYRAIKKVLQKGVKNRGTSLAPEASNYSGIDKRPGENQNFLKIHGRQKEPCPRCRTPIIKCKVAQRGTYLCPNCQREQK